MDSLEDFALLYLAEEGTAERVLGGQKKKNKKKKNKKKKKKMLVKLKYY